MTTNAILTSLHKVPRWAIVLGFIVISIFSSFAGYAIYSGGEINLRDGVIKSGPQKIEALKEMSGLWEYRLTAQAHALESNITSLGGTVLVGSNNSPYGIQLSFKDGKRMWECKAGKYEKLTSAIPWESQAGSIVDSSHAMVFVNTDAPNKVIRAFIWITSISKDKISGTVYYLPKLNDEQSASHQGAIEFRRRQDSGDARDFWQENTQCSA